MKKKEEFYILRKAERAILSIIHVNSGLPLPEETHKEILRLQEVSDIFFIFPPDLFKYPGAKKFGSLYQACGYIETGNLSDTLMRTLEYDREILGGHILTLVSQTSRITNLDGERLQGIAGSDIVKPVFKSRELDSSEFFDIYSGGTERKWWQVWKKQEEGGNENCTHTSDSYEILMRPAGIGKMIEFWETTEGKEWTRSFKKNDLRYFLASLHHKLRIDNLEVGYDEI